MVDLLRRWRYAHAINEVALHAQRNNCLGCEFLLCQLLLEDLVEVLRRRVGLNRSVELAAVRATHGGVLERSSRRMLLRVLLFLLQQLLPLIFCQEQLRVLLVKLFVQLMELLMDGLLLLFSSFCQLGLVHNLFRLTLRLLLFFHGVLCGSSLDASE